ncbi:MAG: 5-methyltetrahydropteroyltriglutamate--homocysteine S-methyltransferase [bacterium]
MANPNSKPPFRADHVGSLLRPKRLLEARAKSERGQLGAQELRAAEDEAIRGAVALQERIGLQGVTDGEYRRTFFHIDFFQQLEGVATTGASRRTFHKTGDEVELLLPTLEIKAKLRRGRGIQIDDFDFLKTQTQSTAKVAIPSPTMLKFDRRRKGVDEKAYPQMDEFFADLAQAFRQEIAELAAHGCSYLQLDDTNLAFLCDPAVRERARKAGENPDRLPHHFAKLINESIRDRPAEMTVCIHLCRGNFRSSWLSQGGYEPVAEVLFGELAVDGYFLEFDDERSGDFQPLRFLPAGKKVVLGLVSSKFPALEPHDLLKRRIDEAAQVANLDDLALSPQCGFSSTVEGNDISEDDQKRKLALVVEVADQVWG